MSSFLFPEHGADGRFVRASHPTLVWLNGILEDGPHLGVGLLIGTLADEAVIQVDDADRSYQLLASECHFGTDIPDLVASGVVACASIREYLLALRTGAVEFDYWLN